MFTIKKISDSHTAIRVCESLGAEEKGAVAYAAFKDENVLATAAFVTDKGGCVVFCGVDTGRRMDTDLADGLARAAFHAQMRAGAKTARLGAGIPQVLRLSLSKRGYLVDKPFVLTDFFARRCKR